MKVWIDLSNSPHPLLFAPIARRLEADGHSVAVTARDHAQTIELAQRHFDEFASIGRPSPAGRGAKLRVLGARVRGLRAWAREQRPDVALSHNSYAQIVAARSLRVPIVTAMDFEHQPANHLAFRLADVILLPEAVSSEEVRRQGATASKVRRYPGVKESLYMSDFEPDDRVLADLGVDRGDPDGIIVVARTPPTGASYHRFENPLFADCLRTLDGQPRVQSVVLTRYPEQAEQVRGPGLERCIVPARAIDSRSAMYSADLVLGAGGTMTREAALLGVPTLSLFAGRRPAVDAWLEERGLMRRLTDPHQLEDLQPRNRSPRPLAEIREEGDRALGAFVAGVEAVAQSDTTGVGNY